MNTEIVLECLYDLGFEPEPIEEDLGYKFAYEGFTVFYATEEGSQSLSFSIPGVYPVSDENRSKMVEALLKLSQHVRYVKPLIMYDYVWLRYEHYLEEDIEPTEELLEHIMRSLAISYALFYRIIENEGDIAL